MINQNLNFFMRGEAKKYDHVITYLDLAILSIKNLSRSENIDFRKFPITQPFHCIVGDSQTHYYVGISNEKAILGMQSMSIMNNTLPSLKSDRHLFEVAEFELGSKLSEVIEIEKQVVNKYKNDLKMIQDLPDQEKINQVNYNRELFSDLHNFADSYVNKKRESERMIQFNPIFRARDLKVDENLVFCILPFDADRLEIFEDIIRKELEKDYGLTVIRANDIFDNKEIMEDIWTYICKARFIIADVSLKNPNVFYELGICHTVGKEVITICDEDSLQNDYNNKLPFDIQSRRTIFYKNSGSGPQKMLEDLKKSIDTIMERTKIAK